MRLKNYFVLLIIVIFTSGCTHQIQPRKYDDDPRFGIVPASIDAANKEEMETQFKKIKKYPAVCSVDLINNFPETTPQPTLSHSGFYVNYNEWTQFFIDEWARVLVDKGVEVSTNSPNKIYVSLNNFNMDEGVWSSKSTIVVRLEADDGNWTKEINSFANRPFDIDVGYNAATYYAIIQLLKDPEVIDRMRAK